MKYIQGALLALSLCFSAFGQSRVTQVENECGPSAVAQPQLNKFWHENMSVNTGQTQPSEKAGIRFLGFDITENGSEKNLTARFAGGDGLTLAYVDVFSGNHPLMCGSVFRSARQNNFAWAINMPLSEVPAILNQEGELEIWMASLHNVNGVEEERISEITYDKQALIELVNHHTDTTLPYQLTIAHPSDLETQRGLNHIVYCLNSRFFNCDYSIYEHPRGDDARWNTIGIALPFKGQLTLDGYVSSILYKEDITSDMKVMATDIGLWNRGVSEPLQLGALHPNSKAFLSQFMTLSHSVDADSGNMKSTIAWDIPIAHGEFLSHSTYARDYNTYLLYNFAVQRNPLGSLQDALNNGFTEVQYHTQTKTSSIAMTGIYDSLDGALKLTPLTVTFP
ncbi:hypothetical protein N473_24100 [Pseudoalteromonas luteoviolacea CPMOR-1]|uniref:Uncharacterized protein n=1 Tax=Pseudoalteromonas luteoviolacea CPMOR-1 TaxID=1365248 RepID=A0A167J6M2_9GAMM|nr:hypothetical protein [Pseudoalteromonas luteoviolacea]KZN60572.1 hypothetical protein N473_24100 [Pseudoalteromonas luteoviolacea CPMOR-1]